jgi:hypothetical protein
MPGDTTATALTEPYTSGVPCAAPAAGGATVPAGSGSARLGFLLLAFLLGTAAGAKAILFDTMDPDCFWHLRVADQLATDGVGPLVDRLSFASVRTPWTPYSWLAELGMKATWDAGGYRAAVAAQAVMQGLFVVLVAWACRRSRVAPSARARFEPLGDLSARKPGGRPSYLTCCVAAAVAGFISLPYLSFRPVTASLVLLAIVMLLLVRDRAEGERTRLVWLVPVLTAVTVNLHLNAVFVPMWLGALLAGAAWERFGVAGLAERPEARRRLSRYLLLTAAAAAGCCCTPMLSGMLRTAMYYTAADPMVASGFISEMRPFFLGTLGQAAAAVVGLSLVVIVGRLGRFRPGERLLLAGGVLALSQWGRFAPIFALTAAPLLAVAAGGLSDRALSRRPLQLALAAVLALAASRLTVGFPPADRPLSAWLNRHGPDAPGYPTEAAKYVAERVTPRTGRLISEFNWGGYLEWAVGDRYQVLLDGRTQLFAPEFWRAAYLDGEAARAALLANVEADAAVLPGRDSRFRRALVRRGWRSVWRDADGRSEVLVPPEAATRGEAATVASDD